MTRRDDAVSLQHMLDHSREAVRFITNRTRDDLHRDRILSLALVQLLQIIGEAANRVSPVRQQQITSISWAQIIALRNRLIHGYDEIDFNILWAILTTDLPPLIAALEEALGMTDSAGP